MEAQVNLSLLKNDAVYRECYKKFKKAKCQWEKNGETTLKISELEEITKCLHCISMTSLEKGDAQAGIITCCLLKDFLKNSVAANLFFKRNFCVEQKAIAAIARIFNSTFDTNWLEKKRNYVGRLKYDLNFKEAIISDYDPFFKKVTILKEGGNLQNPLDRLHPSHYYLSILQSHDRTLTLSQYEIVKEISEIKCLTQFSCPFFPKIQILGNEDVPDSDSPEKETPASKSSAREDLKIQLYDYQTELYLRYLRRGNIMTDSISVALAKYSELNFSLSEIIWYLTGKNDFDLHAEKLSPIIPYLKLDIEQRIRREKILAGLELVRKNTDFFKI